MFGVTFPIVFTKMLWNLFKYLLSNFLKKEWLKDSHNVEYVNKNSFASALTSIHKLSWWSLCGLYFINTARILVLTKQIFNFYYFMFFTCPKSIFDEYLCEMLISSSIEQEGIMGNDIKK
jgi:hypothetical protein